MAIAAGLSAFVGYSIINFMPSFIDRSFGVGIAIIGFWLGLIYGIAGGAGFYFGGYFADRVGRAGYRKAMVFIALSTAASALFYGGVFLATSVTVCMTLLVVPAVIANFYLAPVLSLTQSLVSLRMRAVASSLVLLIINVIGLAMGSPITGFISDLLEPTLGVESMRYSLLIVSSVMLPLAAWCYLRAGKYIDQDLQRADEQD